jgi:hypothetical protein
MGIRYNGKRQIGLGSVFNDEYQQRRLALKDEDLIYMGSEFDAEL